MTGVTDASKDDDKLPYCSQKRTGYGCKRTPKKEKTQAGLPHGCLYNSMPDFEPIPRLVGPEAYRHADRLYQKANSKQGASTPPRVFCRPRISRASKRTGGGYLESDPANEDLGSLFPRYRQELIAIPFLFC